MVKTKKNDFVEIKYTGKLANEATIFDTIDETVAKASGLYNPQVRYGSVITCIGQSMVLPGLDASLEGKEIGEKYSVSFNSGDTFGKRTAKLIQLVPKKTFIKQGINPVPGLQVRFDDSMGVIKSVSGGRCIVDFNHPLAGKELTYDVEIISKVEDKVEQIKSVMELKLNAPKDSVNVKIDGDSAEVTLDVELPEELTDLVSSTITDVVDVKKVVFKYVPTKTGTSKKEVKKPAAKSATKK